MMRLEAGGQRSDSGRSSFLSLVLSPLLPHSGPIPFGAFHQRPVLGFIIGMRAKETHSLFFFYELHDVGPQSGELYAHGKSTTFII